MAELPSGTVTFLFTDIEGSTRLWQDYPDAMRPALARHDELLRIAIEAHDGHVVKTTGDGAHAAFSTASDAIAAGVAAQRGLDAEAWPLPEPLRVRMGIHAGPAELRDGDYYGTAVNRAARIMSVAHGGQILVSLAAQELVRDTAIETMDLGDHRLRDLGEPERIFQVVHPDLDGSFPPLRSLDVLPGNLPRQVTTFVGREAEIKAIGDLVHDSSLVTLTGVGGVGKTRLALQVAAEVVPHFTAGAWCCEYAPVADPGAVWDTLAICLGVQAFPGRSLEESVLEHLAGKTMLLVVDNCEHLLDALAGLVEEIAHRAPKVRVLATSREGLGIPGERMVAVRSLGVPADDLGLEDLVHADAVRLFVDRASAADSGFALTRENAGAVGVLCRRLDGIPLAIELAAARARSMSPDDLVDRLDQRFKLLTRGSRGAVGRQQTLRSAIDWSYDLLDTTERRALDRLSVFAGGCDLTAAEAVLADDDLDAFDVDDVLAQLVDKSLLIADHEAGRVRYRMLETIRQYAEERLEADADTPNVRRRHADYYIALAQTAGPHLVRPEQVEWNATVIRETDNLRAALDWAVETESPDYALQLVAPLTVDTSIGDTATEWATRAIAIPGAEEQALFPHVAAWASWGATRDAQLEQARSFLAVGERAAARLGVTNEKLARARALIAMWGDHDNDEARQRADEWVAVCRAAGDAEPIARALVLQALLRAQAGDLDASAQGLDEAIKLNREHGFLANQAYALITRAGLFPVEQSEVALAMADEAVQIAEQLGGYLYASCTGARAWHQAQNSDWHGVLRSVDVVVEQVAFPSGYYSSSFHVAALAFTALGYPESAAVTIGAVREPAAPTNGATVWGPDLCATNERALAQTLGADHFSALTARGAAFSPDEAAAYLHTEITRLLTDTEPL